MHENQQLQESYQKKVKELKCDIQNYKQQISLHVDAKKALENQINKLKKEINKKIDTQRQLSDKLKAQDVELGKYHEKLFQV